MIRTTPLPGSIPAWRYSCPWGDRIGRSGGRRGDAVAVGVRMLRAGVLRGGSPARRLRLAGY